jgi:hypothetical protein
MTKINYNLFFPFTFRSSKWSDVSKISNQYILCNSHSSHVNFSIRSPYMSCMLHSVFFTWTTASLIFSLPCELHALLTSSFWCELHDSLTCCLPCELHIPISTYLPWQLHPSVNFVLPRELNAPLTSLFPCGLKFRLFLHHSFGHSDYSPVRRNLRITKLITM